MILCVNANAAIDKTVTVRGFRPGAIHRPTSVLMLPGGKGCNVARVLKTLGQDPLVMGWVGGHAGRFIESGLRAEGIASAFVYTPGESRTCLSVLDETNGALTEVYERGEPIPAQALSAFYKRYRSLLPHVRMVTLSGSLPGQVPAGFYADLIADAQRAGVPALLDSSGDALRLGLAAGPRLVKPNRDELAALVRDVPDCVDELACAAAALARQTCAAVVVSLGAEGAVAANPDGETWCARPPAVPAVSAVGSGDAMLAGLVIGLLDGRGLAESLRLGAAAGAANTLTIGAGRLAREDVARLLEGVEATRLQ